MDIASWVVVGRIRSATCTEVVEPDDDDDDGGAIAGLRKLGSNGCLGNE